MLSDFLTHAPTSVLSKNFRLEPEISSHIPASGKYIFQGSIPIPADDEMPDRPHIKESKWRFTHKMLDQDPLKLSEEVRITDTNTFPLSKTASAAHVIIKQRGIRDMHWHPFADEWSFFIRGSAGIMFLASSRTARTFNYTSGDEGIVPKNM
jgi:oxalate decarboxylase/phosphoglucose isomerase-like protein (cupin superfamily)